MSEIPPASVIFLPHSPAPTPPTAQPASTATEAHALPCRYEALRAYSASNGGSCDVPQRYPPSPSLGVWVHTQRRAHAAGRLSPERKARLDELGFVWGAEAPAADSAQRRFEGSLDPGDGGQRMLTPRESPPVRTLDGCEWELNFQDLLRFKSKHGHCRVPDRDRKWPRLALWAADQRRLHSQGLLQPTRVARLSGAGFQLCGSSELEWARMLERLEKVLAMHGGDCGLHTLAAEDEGLGRWLQQQRRALRRRMLPEDRAAQLRSLGPDLLGEGCEVESYGAIWEQQYAELEGHLRCHGHGLSTMPPRLQVGLLTCTDPRG